MSYAQQQPYETSVPHNHERGHFRFHCPDDGRVVTVRAPPGAYPGQRLRQILNQSAPVHDETVLLPSNTTH